MKKHFQQTKMIILCYRSLTEIIICQICNVENFSRIISYHPLLVVYLHIVKVISFVLCLNVGIGRKSFITCGIMCKPRYITVRTPNILSPSEFHRFWITYSNNGLVRVGRGGEGPFMEWQDPSTPLEIQIIGIASYQRADWIGYLCNYEANKVIGRW